MTPRAVVVTGYGAVTPYGQGVGRLVEGLRARRSSVRSMEEDWPEWVEGAYCKLYAPVSGELDVSSIPRKNRRSMGREAILAQLATDEAVRHAGLTPAILGSGRVGAAFGNTIPSPSSLENLFRLYLVERSFTQVPAGGFFRIMGHSCAANVATALGIRGRVVATPAACAAAAFAIGTGCELIRWGVQDAMICGGVEECHQTTSAIFDLVGASSTHCNGNPDRAPAPFDRQRDGTVCGEGAGVVVLESEEHALRRGAHPLGRLLGFAGLADGATMVQAGVESMTTCLTSALGDAGVAPRDIDYVNAHATGTVLGDSTEAQALAAVFGDSVPVSGFKGYLGHTLAASAAIESIAVLEMMAGGYAIPTGKLVEVDPDCAIIRHLLEPAQLRIDRFVKCSFGFGGMNAVVVFGRYADATR